jgi:hypothetical protein
MQSLAGQPSPEANPLYSTIGQGLGNAAQAYRGGAKASEALGRGLSDIGSGIGGGFGNAMAESGQGLQQGRGFGEAMRSGAKKGYDELGGMSGLYKSVRNIGQNLMQRGQRGREAAMEQMPQYMQAANQGHQRQQRYEQPMYEEEAPPPMYARHGMQRNPYQEQEQGYGGYEEYPYEEPMYG